MECAEDKFRVPLDIEPINVVKNEPLSNFFTRFSPVCGALALLFMGVLLMGVTTYFEGTLFPGNPGKTRVPLLKDVNDIALIVGYLPGLFFASLLYYRYIKKLQVDLFQLRIIGDKEFNSVNEVSKITAADTENQARYNSLLRDFRKRYCSWWVTYGCIIIAIAVTYWGFYKNFITLDTWHTSAACVIADQSKWIANALNIGTSESRFLNLGGFFYALFIFALYIYLAANLLYRGIITTVFVNRVFKNFTVNVELLHPDQCGGLKIVGDVADTFTLALLIGAPNIVSLIYTQSKIMNVPLTHPINLLPVASYIILALTMFFGILYTPHKAMKRAKTLLQRDISVSYDILFKKNHANVLAGTINKENIEKLEELQKPYEMAKQAPEWPINIRMIGKLSGTVITVIVPIITKVLPKITSIIKAHFSN